MNSPNNRHHQSLIPSEPSSPTHTVEQTSARQVIENSIEIDRHIFRKVLIFCVVYESLLSLVSVSIASHYGEGNKGDGSCQRFFAPWIVCCCLIYMSNLAIHCCRYYWSEPSRLPFRLPHLRRLNRLADTVKVLFLTVVVTGHILVIGEFHCHQTNSWLYYTALFLLLHSYIVILLFLVLITLAAICYPCFLYLVRPFLKTSKGMSRSEIETLESDTAGNLGIIKEACPICLETYKVSDQIIKLPCEHLMHKKCLKSWLQINASCPMCRAPIVLSGEQSV